MSRTAVVAMLGLFLSLPLGAARSQVQLPEPTGTLTLRDALALVLLQSPDLRATALDLRVAEARRMQMAVRPRPNLAFTAENLGGTVPLSDPELTLSVAQVVELGGKRKARLEVAGGEARVTNFDYEAARLVVLFGTQRRYLEALAAEGMLRLARESVRIADETLSTVRLKVRAGNTSPAEATRSEVDLAKATLELELAREKAFLSHSRLGALWGAPQSRFTSIAGSLDSLAALPDLDSLVAAAAKSPELERWQAELHLRTRRLELARAERVADVEIQAGYRALLESDDHTFVAGVSLPVPFFNRNRGSIVEADILAAKTAAQLAAATSARRLQVVEAYSALAQERTRVAALRSAVLPGARRAYAELKLGYERGRFGYLDVLEARRTWTEAEREELVSLLNFHVAWAELERLVGAPVASPVEGEPR